MYNVVEFGDFLCPDIFISFLQFFISRHLILPIR